MKILILDIETTGLNQHVDMIIELGMVVLDLHTGVCEALFDRRFKEHRFSAADEKAWIFENGFMKVEELDGAKPFAESAKEIQELLKPYQGSITAWNSDFDFKFLRANGIEINTTLPCPMKHTTDYFKLPGKQGRYKWPKAQEAHDILFGLGEIEKHRGYDDAVFEARIIFHLVHKNLYLEA